MFVELYVYVLLAFNALKNAELVFAGKESLLVLGTVRGTVFRLLVVSKEIL